MLRKKDDNDARTFSRRTMRRRDYQFLDFRCTRHVLLFVFIWYKATRDVKLRQIGPKGGNRVYNAAYLTVQKRNVG
jgi:hypothetical protein